ncbi:hypothetical protein Taro_018318 [Colocasia esculenta]|uniref:Secreted protein n=1 Tax=Colocasia esculenta TaxID=4460 RepID=A0A843UYS5_COLES|nr:hypothetical protein [Colocasia esculenta]
MVWVVTCGALLVGGADTSSRHCSPTSPFPVPHFRVLRPETLEVPGMGLRLCVCRSVALRSRKTLSYVVGKR